MSNHNTPSIICNPSRREFSVGSGDDRVTGVLDTSADSDEILAELQRTLPEVDGILVQSLERPSEEMSALIRRMLQHTATQGETLGTTTLTGHVVAAG